MPQIRVHLDYETFSEADIKKVGHIAYAKHHSTEVLMASWCFKAGGANQWTIEDGDIPSELRDILENRNGKYECWAHNASFEMAITIYAAARQFGLKLPRFRKWIQNWHCSMVAGMSMSLPGTLKEQGEVLGSDIRKQADGMRLINLFCKPRKATKKSDAKRNWPWSKPIEWDQFCSYNRDDALAERANWRRISAFPMPAHEWDLWRLDQVINFRGLPIDEELVDAALDVNAQVQELLKKEMKKVTKLANPNSPTQLLAWLNERGYPFDNLRKATVEKTLKDFNAGESSDADIDEIVARVLDLRLLTSRTSIRKYNALKAGTVEGRMFGVFQFCGAGRTWRWAGRRFQPQNLPRGIFKTAEQMATAIAAVKRRDIEYLATMYDLENIPDVLASLIRCAIRAKAGKVMTVADLSSIESVMLAWAANSEYMLDLFRNGLDIYKDFATHWLKVPYNEVTKAMRQLCKPPSLGCGYLLGAKGLIAYADGMGVKLDKKEAKAAVQTYRTAYPDVPRLWKDLDMAARKCIATGETVWVNGKFRFRMQKPCMMIDLPSGRSLCYVRPKIERRSFRWEDDDTGEIKELFRNAIVYEGRNQKTGRWERIATHAGKITENIVQAIARDILAQGLTDADADLPELEICLHVHDEIGGESPDDKDVLDGLQEIMARTPPWGPDIPLGSAGFQNVFYRKD